MVLGAVELALVAVGLSMDAFAVSICKGLGMAAFDMRRAAQIAAFFGGFQALMPVCGWVLGEQFARFVEAAGGWIAFGLLAFIGAKMIRDACREDGADAGASGATLGMGELVMLSVATSIDAFAVGVAFALVHADIIFAALFIGVTTFALSFAGVAIGSQFGARWEKPSTIIGGIVLVAIGIRILIS